MKETYLSRDFRETAAQCFPSQAKELNAFFDARLNVLLAENADASKEKQYHLKRQILPGIAAYETLQRVMPKEKALQIVHGYPIIGVQPAQMKPNARPPAPQKGSTNCPSKGIFLAI